MYQPLKRCGIFFSVIISIPRSQACITTKRGKYTRGESKRKKNVRRVRIQLAFLSGVVSCRATCEIWALYLNAIQTLQPGFYPLGERPVIDPLSHYRYAPVISSVGWHGAAGPPLPTRMGKCEKEQLSMTLLATLALLVGSSNLPAGRSFRISEATLRFRTFRVPLSSARSRWG